MLKFSGKIEAPEHEPQDRHGADNEVDRHKSGIAGGGVDHGRGQDEENQIMSD